MRTRKLTPDSFEIVAETWSSSTLDRVCLTWIIVPIPPENSHYREGEILSLEWQNDVFQEHTDTMKIVKKSSRFHPACGVVVSKHFGKDESLARMPNESMKTLKQIFRADCRRLYQGELYLDPEAASRIFDLAQTDLVSLQQMWKNQAWKKIDHLLPLIGLEGLQKKVPETEIQAVDILVADTIED